MNSLSRGWLFILFFALVAVLVFAARGVGGQGDIKGAVEVGPNASTNPGLPYAGDAQEPEGASPRQRAQDEDDENQPAPPPTRASRQPDNTIYSAGDQILPLSGGSDELDAYVGRRVTARSVPVQSVVADEGFWVGTAGDRVWVQLQGPPPESPYHVERGDEVTFEGEVVAHGPDFAERTGVNRAEGSRSLVSQGAHLAVAKQTMRLEP